MEDSKRTSDILLKPKKLIMPENSIGSAVPITYLFFVDFFIFWSNQVKDMLILVNSKKDKKDPIILEQNLCSKMKNNIDSFFRK